MYCAKCGTLISTDAKFCTKCGSPVSNDSSEKSIEAPVVPAVVKKPKALSLYIATVLFLIGYVSVLTVQIQAGKSLPPQMGGGLMFWTGVLCYYWWKRFNREGWNGALVGAAIGLFLFTLVGFFVGITQHT